MVILDELNRICARRIVANSRPSQILCRLLGNRVGPCPIDPICKPCDDKGLWVIYAGLAGLAGAVFFILFWILRLTRLSRVLGFATRLFLPPLRWCLQAVDAVKRFYDELPG